MVLKDAVNGDGDDGCAGALAHLRAWLLRDIWTFETCIAGLVWHLSVWK